MATQQKVQFVIEAVDNASQTVDKITDKVEGVGKQAKFTQADFAAAGASIVWSIWMIWSKAVNIFADFEKTMSGVNAVLKPTQEEFAKLTDLARELWRSTQFSAQESADALEMLAKNGLNASQILNGAADATLNLASATGAQLSTAADIATSAMLSFWLQVEDLDQVVNSITGTTNVSKFGIEDYALALAQGWGVAKATGVSFKDFNTVIAAISPLFQSGSDAGTSFKTFLLRLVPGSIAAASAMQDLGLMTKEWKNQFFDATWKMKSMSEVSQLLHDALKGLSDEQRNSALNTIFGTDAMRAASWMANFTKEQLDELQKSIENTDAAENAKVRMNNLRGAFEQLSGAIDDIFISIGQLLAPAVKIAANAAIELAGGIASLFKRFGQMPQPVQDFAKILGATTTAVIVIAGAAAFLSVTLSGVAAAFGAILVAAAPWIAAAAVIAGGLYLLYQARQTNFGGIRDITTQAFTEIQTRFNKVSAERLPIITAAMQNIRLAIQYVRNQIRTQTKPIVELMTNFIRDNWDTIAAITSTIREWIIASFQLTFWTLIGLLKAFLQVIGGDRSGARETIKSTVFNARNAVQTMFSTGAEAVKMVLWLFLEAVKLARDMARTSILGSATLQRNNIVNTGRTLRASFATTLQGIRTWIKTFAVSTRNAIKEETLWTFGVIIDRIGKTWKEWFEASFSNAIGWLAGIAKSVFNGIIWVIEWFVNNAIDWINKLIDASNRFNPFGKIPTVPRLALWRLAYGGIAGEWFFGWSVLGDGGFVRGAAGIDKVPAMLTAGEVVLNAAQQNNLARQLNGWNSWTTIVVQIQWNEFFWSEESFAWKIGDSIIAQLKNHISI